MKHNLFTPNWSVPSNICSVYTTRRSVTGRTSPASFNATCYDFFNLAEHVDDDLSLVRQNRALLKTHLNLSKEPLWLSQTHSTQLVENKESSLGSGAAPSADGSFSYSDEEVCVIMTADCLPVLFTTDKGDWVAAVHAGWRGLVDGILLETLKNYRADGKVLAWIGPAISQKYFEVGEEVKAEFCQLESKNKDFFKPSNENNKWLCDLAGIAKHQLTKQGVEVTQSHLCSFGNKEDFYSYRRDGKTGRMASLIWINESREANL